MTKPGDSDEWWKQYGGQGVSPESGAQSSVPQYPTPEPSGYPSAPQYPQQPQQSQPQYPQQPSQPQYQQPYPQQPSQPNYGYQQPPGYQPYGQPLAQGTNGLAIGALVSSLIGLCTCSIGSIVGIILGVIALNQLKERPGQEGRGMALSGIWVGAGGIVAWIIYVAVILATS
ncbi:DUF4190 domain-containing protein [Nocardia bovistercoris]|uniref:DUF4190 domain-containing protein n=1 Tax=Nocardia bovistercoris TaxID=2785916 RepID=A0A931N5W1_9NOCA|nr:DUF4190 domain-containing protein [Nocardia bovistercoris]MBH0779078.1 DUF4190 domain-containing protein [Nocardia bovistercoris]